MQASTERNFERDCISAGLLRPELIPEAGVARGDFLDPRLGSIWQAMEDLIRADQPIEAAVVATKAGQPTLVYELLANGVPTGENIAWHGRQVRDQAIDREVRQLVDKALRDKDCRGTELLTSLQDQLAQVRLPQQKRGRELRDGLLQTFEAIEARHKKGGGPIGVRTGLAELDRATSGLPRGVPFVVAARPGVGKSALCLTIARLAAWYGSVVDYYSLEDTEEIWHCRALAQTAHLDLQSVRSGDLRAEEWRDLSQAGAELGQVLDKGGPGHILIIDDLPRRIEDLSRTIGANAVRRKTDLVVVDYMQLLRAPAERKHSGTRNDELTFCMQELTRLARRHNLALILAAQLRRDADEAQRPGLRHIKDCGQIEQDCRGALLLASHKWRGEDDKLLPFRIGYLEKNTNGPAPRVFPLAWDARSVSFGDCDEATTRQFWALMKKGRR